MTEIYTKKTGKTEPVIIPKEKITLGWVLWQFGKGFLIGLGIILLPLLAVGYVLFGIFGKAGLEITGLGDGQDSKYQS